jgi:hypothetical protein
MAEITPNAIVLATIIMQASVLLIVYIGARILKIDEPPPEPGCAPKTPLIFELTAALAIVSIIFIGLTDTLSGLWRPIADTMPFRGIPWEGVLLTIWIVDIFLLAGLTWHTWGSHLSPFSSLYFVFPTIALFLHEPRQRVILYTGLVIALYSITSTKKPEEEIQTTRLCFWFVTVACFVLTTGMGIMTRR